MTRLYDKDKKLMDYRVNPQGAIVTKGKRTLYLLFKSVASGKKARQTLADNSFNKLFNKGKKIKVLGVNTSYIKF